MVMENGLIIRRAAQADLEDIRRIYNHAILRTTATFNTEPKTLEDWEQTYAQQTERYPLLVAAVDGKVAGWALIRPYGHRQAYEHSVENAIYLDDDYQGRGIGSALLGELIGMARELGFHTVLALIVAGNDASVKLHEKHGYAQVGVLREVGRKFDRWLDIVVMQRML